MPPDTSRLERGGCEFLQCFHRKIAEAGRERRLQERNQSLTAYLRADGGALGVGEGLGEALDVGFVFGFDHDAGALLGAGVAKDDAAIVAKCGLGFGEGAGDFRKRLERRFRTHHHVDDELRIILEAFDKRFDFAVHGDQRGNLCGREQAVAGRAVLEKNDVAGLLASQNVAAAKHFFQNISIADSGAGQRDIFAGKNGLETQGGHGGSDDAVTYELILRFEKTRGGKKHAVAIHNFPGLADEERAVGVTIKGHTEARLLSDDAFLQALQVQRTTAGVDVPAVGRSAHGDNISAERPEKLRAELECCAIGAIENDPETTELCPGNEALPEKAKVFGVERFISGDRRRVLRCGLAPVLQDASFELFFDSVGEFHTGVRKQLHTIVFKGIVRGGDDHAGLKIILPHQTSHAGSGDHASEGHRRASLREARRKQGGDVRAGFASVHSDEGVSGAMFALEIRAESAPRGVEGSVVQRRRARDAANTVGSKKLLGHWKKPVSPECDSGPVGPTSAWMTSEKHNTRKYGDFTAGSRSFPLHNLDNFKNQLTTRWICCLETPGHDATNSLRECANVEPRSRPCPPRKRHHRSFALPVQTSVCK